nr:protein FAR1-related sequence 5-like [Tanacetum cinerariifolium]
MLIILAYFVDASPYVDSESDNECRRPTPNGHKYWIPDLLVEEKPTKGDVFDNFDEAYNMYLQYSQKARFPIGKYTNKRKNGPRDAQMLVDKLNDRKKHVPNFSFEYKTMNDELPRMFRADETMKCNYIAFGDVVSFDATYRTNRYRMIFVPFIGIDHHQKSIKFGVTTPNEVVVKVPKGIRNKGCGTEGARFIGPGEKAKNKAKTKQQGRSCSLCFETGHNTCTSKRNKSKGKEIVSEESEDEEQADDNDTSDHATSDTEYMSSSIDTQGLRNKGCGYTGPHGKAIGKAK